MDVTCERCSTEYEFDDALVSERGTTVKCTTCGHQFRVRRTDGVAQPERWLVRTVDGRELEFSALRDLQHAIAQVQIARDDVLTRGTARPRRLGSIAELAPFFGPAGISVPSMGSSPSLFPPEGVRARMPTPAGLGAIQPGAGRTEGSVVIPLPAPPPRRALGSVPPMPRPPSVPPVRVTTRSMEAHAPDDMLETIRHAAPRVEVPAPKSPPLLVKTPAITEASLPVVVSPRREPSIPPPLPATPAPRSVTPAPASTRNSVPAFDEPDVSEASPSTMSKPSSGARLMVGVLTVGLAAFAAVTVAKKYLTQGSTTAAVTVSDERIATLLHEGGLRIDEGDLESAKEQFDKASALAERDPRVAMELAHLAAIRADFRWLEVKILAPDDPALKLAQRSLDDATVRLGRAAADAANLAPDDPVTVRARMDALRVAGEGARARALVAQLGASSTQPETSLALASLDLMEEKPDWAPVLRRLRLAVAAEKKLGRARALLVYALARSGDEAGAKAELGELLAAPRPNPAAPSLKAYVARMAGEAAAKPAEGAQPAASAQPAESASAAVETPAPSAAPVETSRPTTGNAPTPRATPRVPDDGRVPDDYVYVPPDATAQIEKQQLPAPTANPDVPAPPPPDKSDMPGHD